MSVVDDIRKLLQDVVTPDLKALEVRIASLEKKTDTRIDALEKYVDLRFDASEKKADSRADALEMQADLRADALEKKADLRADHLSREIDMTRTQLNEKIDLSSHLILAEMRATKASLEGTILQLQQSIELERRVAKMESERAAESAQETAERIA